MPNLSSLETPHALPSMTTKFIICQFSVFSGCFAWNLAIHHPGLLVGYETPSPIDWHHRFVNGESKYRLGMPQSQWIVSSRDRWGFPVLQRPHWLSLYHWYVTWVKLIRLLPSYINVMIHVWTLFVQLITAFKNLTVVKSVCFSRSPGILSQRANSAGFLYFSAVSRTSCWKTCRVAGEMWCF